MLYYPLAGLSGTFTYFLFRLTTVLNYLSSWASVEVPMIYLSSVSISFPMSYVCFKWVRMSCHGLLVVLDTCSIRCSHIVEYFVVNIMLKCDMEYKNLSESCAVHVLYIVGRVDCSSLKITLLGCSINKHVSSMNPPNKWASGNAWRAIICRRILESRASTPSYSKILVQQVPYRAPQIYILQVEVYRCLGFLFKLIALRVTI